MADIRLISWNVNGLRACLKKDFMDYFTKADADFFCIQESKLQAGQIDLETEGYYQFWNYAEKKGYSGKKRATQELRFLFVWSRFLFPWGWV